MSVIVVFDEGASPQKVLEVHPSADTPQYDGRTDVLVNPDLAPVTGILRKYWKVVVDAVLEYTQGEKDAQDAAEAAAAELAMRTGAQDQFDGQTTWGQVLRAIVSLLIQRFNLVGARLNDIEAELDALRAINNKHLFVLRDKIVHPGQRKHHTGAHLGIHFSFG